MKKKYGYFGPKGTNSEEALYVYLGTDQDDAEPYPGIEQVLAAVSGGIITHGVVPAENSIEGTVNLTLDLLAQDEKLKIVGEIVLPIKHNLMVMPGLAKEKIEIIVSHPQALAQCRNYLNRNFPGAVISAVNSTAEAAQIVARGTGVVAAIGSQRAAKYYNLETIDLDIQDCRENMTRFLVISKTENTVIGSAKTSVIVSITDRPGGLYEILKEFALANINLTKIESRPAKKNLGDYLFFIDLRGHLKDPAVKKCLDSIKDMTTVFRVLGSYPEWGSVTRNDADLGMIINRSVPQLRQDIDIIDYQIVELLAKRTQIVSLIGALKRGRKPVRDKGREAEIIKRVKSMARKKGVNPELLVKIYETLFDYFVELQETGNREACKGFEGS